MTWLFDYIIYIYPGAKRLENMDDGESYTEVRNTAEKTYFVVKLQSKRFHSCTDKLDKGQC